MKPTSSSNSPLSLQGGYKNNRNALEHLIKFNFTKLCTHSF